MLSAPEKLLLVFWFLFAAGYSQTTAAAEAKIPFSDQIAPIFAEKCLVCHNDEKAKGHYSMQTLGGLMRPGGSKKPPIIPGDPEGSELFARLVAQDEDDRMPQKDEPLPADQIGLIKTWIATGAELGEHEPNAQLASVLTVVHPAPPEHYPAPAPVLALAFDASGNRLVSGGFHELLWWDLEGKLLARVTNISQATFNIRMLAQSGAMAIAGGDSGRNGELRILEPGRESKLLFRHTDILLALAADPERQLLAAGGSDNAIRLFDFHTARQTQLIQQHSDWVASLDFSPDGSHLLSGSRDRTARVYSTATGELESTYTEHSGPVYAVVFTPDGKSAISAGKEKNIHLWRIENAKKVREFSGGEGETHQLLCAGEQLFSASSDGAVHQFDWKSGKQTGRFEGSSDWLYGLAIDPQHKLLAAGSYDGNIFIWELSTRKLTAHFKAFP
jgi:WD40 repeat protein